MKVIFKLFCQTVWGQEVYLIFTPHVNGTSKLKMEYIEDYVWVKDITIPQDDLDYVHYSYIIMDSKGTSVKDGAGNRSLSTKAWKENGYHNVIIMDSWISPSEPSTLLFTSFFTQVVYKSNEIKDIVEKKSKKIDGKKKTSEMHMIFKVFAPWLQGDEAVFIVGNIPEFGDWDTYKAIGMEKIENGVWLAEVSIDSHVRHGEYKYIIKDEKGLTIKWEEGANRHFELTDGDFFVVNDNIFRSGKLWRGTGVAVPVFSLRSENSLGTGEFNDLKLLVDWAVQSGLKVIQILPVNDTTRQYGWMDAYPYSCISVYALHPLYLNIEAIGDIPEDIKSVIHEEKKRLNSFEHLEYEEVMKIKIELARRLFGRLKDDFFKSKDFQDFFHENAFWLKSYALFCALRDRYSTSHFMAWNGYKDIKPETIEVLISPGSEFYEDVCFCYFLQYHLHCQLMEASIYAKNRGVALKGDIPIGVHPDSHECWIYPHIFHMDRSAGAPPDPFSDQGQNWGFPTYNWDRMAEDDYLWWKNRLKKMSQYFQLVRLDHVLGFFRIWEIPKGMYSGLMGRFNPVLPITKDELEREGFKDLSRLCEPYITLDIIGEVFDELKDYVMEVCLEPRGDGLFTIKEDFSDQAKIDLFLETHDMAEKVKPWQKGLIREGLFKLLSNFILFKDEMGRGFHFRINMMHTSSFKYLERWQQDRLIALYNDYFYHRQDELWRNSAMKKLPMLKEASNMLICGEDLGMIPDCVQPVMEELCLLGLRIQRMPKETGREFGCPWEYQYLTVCTTSSHDMSTLRGWWEEERERAARFYNHILKKQGPPPEECTSDIVRDIILQHLESPSMLAVFPIQDLLSMSDTLRRRGDPHDEQINNPADPYHRWRYRMHITIEDLLKDKDFSEMLLSMATRSGRV